MSYQIAQINIARMVAPLDSPVMADFVANLDQINALAEAAPGFVWRLKGEGNDATSLRPYEDDRIIVNMSVWQSIDALFQYTYYTAHTDFFRRRAEWFEKLATPAVTLWWVAAGHEPTPAEGRERLEYLAAHGPTPHAFTFKQHFSPEEAAAYARKAVS
ncbi:MAG: DUF3291 domain-containing protein [Anaerolineae bacterium]|nr:DUF3291 domain-containing protein [Anaerolineae bacterium]